MQTDNIPYLASLHEYGPGVVANGHRQPLFREDAVYKYVTGEVLKLSKNIPKIMSEANSEAMDAATRLREAMQGIGDALEGLKPAKKSMIDELRSLRMTAVSETAATLKPLEELRQFFLGPDHNKEIARLREFVELCERLEALKRSGFLDSVAETMLKIA